MTDEEQRPEHRPEKWVGPVAEGDRPDRAEPATPRSFGDPRVDAAVARTDGLDGRPVSEHVEVFDDVHRSLTAALDDPGDGA